MQLRPGRFGYFYRYTPSKRFLGKFLCFVVGVKNNRARIKLLKLPEEEIKTVSIDNVQACDWDFNALEAHQKAMVTKIVTSGQVPN